MHPSGSEQNDEAFQRSQFEGLRQQVSRAAVANYPLRSRPNAHLGVRRFGTSASCILDLLSAARWPRGDPYLLVAAIDHLQSLYSGLSNAVSNNIHQLSSSRINVSTVSSHALIVFLYLLRLQKLIRFYKNTAVNFSNLSSVAQ